MHLFTTFELLRRDDGCTFTTFDEPTNLSTCSPFFTFNQKRLRYVTFQTRLLTQNGQKARLKQIVHGRSPAEKVPWALRRGLAARPRATVRIYSCMTRKRFAYMVNDCICLRISSFYTRFSIPQYQTVLGCFFFRCSFFKCFFELEVPWMQRTTRHCISGFIDKS